MSITNTPPLIEKKIPAAFAQCEAYSWKEAGYNQLLLKSVVANPGPFESNTGSDTSLQLVNSWIAQCLSSHQSCNQIQSLSPSLPTRVIDVGSRDSGHPPRLHVVADKESGRYTTLSHRWGSKEMMKLTVDNLECLKQEIPWETLPKTYRDAIEATRRLGIRYIWIDSLCIIQDSPNGKDWIAESAKMATVYENSLINFAATNAVDSTTGCFFSRNPASVRPVRLYFDWDHISGYFYSSTNHIFRNHVSNSPLYRRGWVFQERTLAPRILHCCAKQLYWECHETIACEGYPSGLPHFFECNLPGSCSCQDWRRMRPLTSDTYNSIDISSSSPVDVSESLVLWSQMVHQYQALDLTYARDKLVAISGLAKMYSRSLNTKYLAGMWLEQLPMQLLWEKDDEEHPMGCRPYTGYIAPTWSWASLPGLVNISMFTTATYDGKTHYPAKTVIEILDGAVDLVDENNAFGDVTGGALRIKGPLANSESTFMCGKVQWEYQDRAEIWHDESYIGEFSLDHARYVRELPCKSPLHFLPIMMEWGSYYGSQRNSPTNVIMGLLIQETDHGENIFQRVGVFRVNKRFYSGNAKVTGGVHVLQEACRSQNGTDEDGEFPEWGKPRVFTLI